MAYLRRVRKNHAVYYALAESYRDEKGRPRTRFLCYIGKSREHANEVLGRYRAEGSKVLDEYRGWVYVIGITEDGVTPRYKIGYSKNVKARLEALARQIPFRLEVITKFRSPSARLAERRLQNIMQPFQISGEWFELPAAAVTWLRNLKGVAVEDPFHELCFQDEWLQGGAFEDSSSEAEGVEEPGVSARASGRARSKKGRTRKREPMARCSSCGAFYIARVAVCWRCGTLGKQPGG